MQYHHISESHLAKLLKRDTIIENTTFEVKRATGKDGLGKVPDDFYPTYCAMTNTLGGTVVFGLEEIRTKTGEPIYKITGIPNPQKVVDQLFSTLNNKTKVNKNLLKNEDVEIIPVENSFLIKISIPRAEREQRPIYLNNNPIENTYIRNASGDHLISEDDVRLMIREASSETVDAEILQYYTIADLNPQSVLAYRNLFRITNISHPWNSLTDEEFLKRIKAVSSSREMNISGVTKAGLLMFGDALDIRDHFPNYYLDYLEKYTEDKAVRYDNKISSNQGTWSGNIFDFFMTVNRKLSEGLDIPFRLQGKQRIDENRMSEVLREALINTLIHADYTGTAPVKIKKSPQEFVFINPGDMRRPLALAKHGGISDCRNRILQTMFGHIGYGDQEGFGVAAIFDVWERETGRVPEYAVMKDPVSTELKLMRGDGGEMSVTRNSESLEGEPQSSLKVNLSDNSTPQEDLTAHLKHLNSTPQEGLTAHLKHLNSTPQEILTRNLEILNKEPQELNREQLISLLTIDTQEKVLNLGKRASPDDMMRLIREICAQRSFTATELAVILNRKNKRALSDRYLLPLLREHKIEKTNPEKPNHPNQKYRTILSEKK